MFRTDLVFLSGSSIQACSYIDSELEMVLQRESNTVDH